MSVCVCLGVCACVCMCRPVCACNTNSVPHRINTSHVKGVRFLFCCLHEEFSWAKFFRNQPLGSRTAPSGAGL